MVPDRLVLGYKPYLVLGLALGGVFAMSGVGLVVLYRATGVLNLAYGAIGAIGALITWSLLDRTGIPEAPAYLVCVALRRRRHSRRTAPSSGRRSQPATRSSRRWRRSAFS